MTDQCDARASKGHRCQFNGSRWTLTQRGVAAWVCAHHDDSHVKLHQDPTTMDDFPNIGTTIKELREMRDWSQRELSRQCGVSRKTLQSYESGKCNPTLKQLYAVAEAFDARPSGLLKDAGL